MSPGASFDQPADSGRERAGIRSAWVIAILFLTVAAVSFAVDQCLTLSIAPHHPPGSSVGR